MHKKFLLLIVLALSLSSVATAQSEMQQLQVPPVAPDYRAPQKPLPELNRVGVDMNRQRPLSLRRNRIGSPSRSPRRARVTGERCMAPIISGGWSSRVARGSVTRS